LRSLVAAHCAVSAARLLELRDWLSHCFTARHQWRNALRLLRPTNALYHRDAGKVVKLRDDLISATRYALMCLRFARPAGETSFARKLHYPALGIV
jgi:hypothetical protein